MNAITTSHDLSASRIRRVVRERKRMIFGVVAAFAAAGALIAYVTPPVYRASARVEFRTPEEGQPWSGQDRSSNYQSENAALYTSAEQITGRHLLVRIAAALERPDALVASENGTGHRTKTAGRPWFDVASAQATADANAAVEVDPASVDPDRLESRIRELKRSIRIQPVKDTRLVDIQVEDADPEIARAVASRLARLFVASESERAYAADTTGLGFLLTQIDEVKERMAMTSDALMRHGEAGNAFAAARVEQLRSKISGLGGAYVDARNDRLESQARFDVLKGAKKGDVSSRIYDSDVMRASRAQVDDAKAKLAAAREVYGPKHPKVVALETEANAARGRLDEEAGRAASALAAERRMHSMREGALGSELARATDELASMQLNSKRQTIEESELAVDQELYTRLLSRARQMGYERKLTTATVAVAEPAAVDPSPVRPRRLLTFIVCLATGVLVGVGFALLGDGAARTIRSPGDAEAGLDLPVLGQISKQQA